MAKPQVDLLLFAFAFEHERIDIGHCTVLGGQPGVYGVIPGNEEPRIGKPDPAHHIGADQHPLEGARICELEALAVELPQAVRQRHAQELIEPRLPVERGAVEIVTTSVDDAEAPEPRLEPLERVGKYLHIVIHQPYPVGAQLQGNRKSTRLNSSHVSISYAVFCLKKKNLRRDDGLKSNIDNVMQSCREHCMC